ncbi:MAG: tetratricopeptide repeat protein [Kiritimatiellia bacterium]
MDITPEPVSAKTRDLVNKGFAALERGNLDYAIDMLTTALSQEPGCIRTRKYLRAAQIKKFHSAPSNHHVNLISLLPQVVSLFFMLQSKKGEEALAAAEKLMRKDPLNMTFIKMFVQAAEQAGCPEIAVLTLSQVREFYPQDFVFLTCLGEMYLKTNQPRQAREIFEKIAEARPNDMNILKDLKDAMALDSMSKDGWNSAGPDKDGFRRMLRDESKAVILEQTDKVVKSEGDVAALITDTLQKVAKEPANINYRRHLANLYLSTLEFDKAINALEEAQNTGTGRDPQIDAAIASSKIAKLEHEAGLLETAGDKAGAAAKLKEMDDFKFDNLRERVTRYPNDLALRFELGVSLFNRRDLNEAIQQFQLAQKSAAERVRALHYIGQCFTIKKQYDMAVDQLSRAASEIQGMSDLRKDIIYDLALVYELLGDKARAIEQFKIIYQVDFGYKDVAKRIEQGYAS